jgi:hypothetical protein
MKGNETYRVAGWRDPNIFLKDMEHALGEGPAPSVEPDTMFPGLPKLLVLIVIIFIIVTGAMYIIIRFRKKS